MLLTRLSSSVGGSSIPRQTALLRTATTWASPSHPPSSLSAKPQQPQAQSPSAPVNGNTSRGRSKPYRSSSFSRPRPHSLRVGFFSSSSPEHRSISSLSLSPSETSTRKTQGRRRRSSSLARSSSSSISASVPSSGEGKGIFSQCQIPVAQDYTFRPIALYPQPLHLHMAFTPSHQPIMANLGTKRFLQPPKRRSGSGGTSVDVENLFSPPSPPSPVRALTRSKARNINHSGMPILPMDRTGLGDHLSVIKALSHPTLQHHLLSPPEGPAGGEDVETRLMRIMAESDVKHTLSAEWAFEDVLARLGDKEAATAKAIKEGEVRDVAGLEGEKAELAEALEGLEGVLQRLDMGDAETGKGRSGGFKEIKYEVKVVEVQKIVDGEYGVENLEIRFPVLDQQGVMMDSVKRKRKKMIRKHKYQKRRKATRAQRKRLGK